MAQKYGFIQQSSRIFFYFAVLLVSDLVTYFSIISVPDGGHGEGGVVSMTLFMISQIYCEDIPEQSPEVE